MTDDKKNVPSEVTPAPKALYTEKFARKKARRDRRAMLFGGIAFTLCGILTLRETIVAIRTHTLVLMGRVGGIEYPPFITGPMGVLSIVIGLCILGSLLVRHHEK